MQAYLPYLDSLRSQKQEMIATLEQWVGINSYTDNSSGLKEMADTLEKAFSSLGGTIQRIPLAPRKKIDSNGKLVEIPTGDALSIKKHSNVPFKVLLAGHMDHVYPPQSSFQKAERLDAEILRGPGVVDMKGGLLIMLKAVEALESSPFAGKIGWEILINSDEEVGSSSSEHLFKERAPHFNLGLIFEPAFPDGSLVNERKGSVNYAMIARGKAAHAGRDYYAGRNAIIAMARFVQGIQTLNDRRRGITVNVGSFQGGGHTNIVPDLAICKVNIRMENPKDLPLISAAVNEMMNGSSLKDEITFEYYEETKRSPKPFDKPNRLLFEAFHSTALDLGLNLKWQPSGGVCDGNTLYEAGLPTIDTLGAVGGHMHTHDEFILVNSLVERSMLTALFLMHLADNKYDFGDLK